MAEIRFPDKIHRRRMYALVSDQGTACAETAMCGKHLREARDKGYVLSVPHDVVDPTYVDCSGNEALSCC